MASRLSRVDMVLPAFGRMRQKSGKGRETSLGYTVRPCVKRNKKTEWLVSDFRYMAEILISWVTRVLLKEPWSSVISLSSWC